MRCAAARPLRLESPCGAAWAAAEELDLATLATEGGVKVLMQLLRVKFRKHEEQQTSDVFHDFLITILALLGGLERLSYLRGSLFFL